MLEPDDGRFTCLAVEGVQRWMYLPSVCRLNLPLLPLQPPQGLNLAIRRVVFTSLRKFDGREERLLTTSEVKQVWCCSGVQRWGDWRGRRHVAQRSARSAHSCVHV